MKKTILLNLLLICLKINAQEEPIIKKVQPENYNVFQHFKKDMKYPENLYYQTNNAALLAYLNWLNYPMYLYNRESIEVSNSKFENDFKQATEDLFWNPYAPEAPEIPVPYLEAHSFEYNGKVFYYNMIGIKWKKDARTQSLESRYKSEVPVSKYSQVIRLEQLLEEAKQSASNYFEKQPKFEKQPQAKLISDGKLKSNFKLELITDEAKKRQAIEDSLKRFCKYKLDSSYLAYTKSNDNFRNETLATRRLRKRSELNIKTPHDLYLYYFKKWKESKPYIKFITNSLKIMALDPEAMFINTPQAIYIVFRGTDRVGKYADKIYYEWGEWITTDANVLLTTPRVIQGKVHAGFWKSLAQIIPNLEREITKYNPDKSKPIWITGHSLGAGQAQLFTSYLELSGYDFNKLYCYMYGGPTFVGDAVYAQSVNTRLGAHIQRIEFKDDFLTRIPVPCGYEYSGFRNKYKDRFNLEIGKDEIGVKIPCINNPLESTLGSAWNGLKSFFDDIPNSFNMLCDHNMQHYVRATYESVKSSGITSEQKRNFPSPPGYNNIPNSYMGACSN